MSATAKIMELANFGSREPKLDTAPSCVAFVGDLQSHAAVTAACQPYYPDVQVRDGMSRQALEWLAESAPPKVLIVDVSDAAKPLSAILPIIAALEDRTRVIAIGTVNDIGLYHEIVQSGVQDYLVKPVSEKILAGTLAAIEARQQAALTVVPGGQAAAEPQPKRLIAVVGTRGGVGTSTVAVNCAWIIAEEHKTSTTLLDLDLQYGTVALALDIEPTRGLREALENPGRIDSLFISSTAAKVTSRLSVLAAEESVDDEVRYDDSAIALLFDELHRQSDCIVVDIPRAAAKARSKVLSLATDIFIVSDMTLAGLRDAIRQLGLAQQVAPNAHIFVIADRVISKDGSLSKAEFEKALGHAIDITLPEEHKAVQAAATSGKPLAATSSNSRVVAQLREIVKKVYSTQKAKASRSLWPFGRKGKK